MGAGAGAAPLPCTDLLDASAGRIPERAAEPGRDAERTGVPAADPVAEGGLELRWIADPGREEDTRAWWSMAD